jgi:hypothetical protein
MAIDSDAVLHKTEGIVQNYATLLYSWGGEEWTNKNNVIFSNNFRPIRLRFRSIIEGPKQDWRHMRAPGKLFAIYLRKIENVFNYDHSIRYED